MTGRLRANMASIERTGAWDVPEHIEARLFWGNIELDFRAARFASPTVTIDLRLRMANLEIIVPPEIAVDLDVEATMANVESHHMNPPDTEDRRRIRIVGRARMGNVTVMTLHHGESRDAARLRGRLERHRERHAMHHRFHEERLRGFAALRAEKELWRDARRGRRGGELSGPATWMPWWLLGRMRRRITIWMAMAIGVGMFVGWRLGAADGPRWWPLILVFVMLGGVSSGIAWSLTRPLIMVIKAARDIGDGKLDTRLAVEHQRGEMRLLASAINDMAAKIESQMKDQRTLLAAVSHELRTPLGHMRVLVETARDTGSQQALAELDKEILVLDDLVGRLLASSRLEFGNLDRRPTNLGELASDVATQAGVPPEAIEAIGDCAASVDATLIRRAIANLVDNAKKHGNGATAVRIERRGAQIAVEVDDAGPGVPADRRADAFRAFVPSSGGGLGLGLALVSRIAVAHAGAAWIADRPGGGARVGFNVSAS